MPGNWRYRLQRKLLDFRATDGATAIEFALVSLPFVMLLFGALQLALTFQAQGILETAAEQAGRTVLTGAAQNGNQTQAQFKTAVCATIPAILSCTNLMVDVQVASSFSAAVTAPPAINFNGNGAVTNNWNYNLGNPGDVVVLRLVYMWPLLNIPGISLSNLSNKTRLLIATSVFKNEVYK